jgi:hypothetical protein
LGFYGGRVVISGLVYAIKVDRHTRPLFECWCCRYNIKGIIIYLVVICLYRNNVGVNVAVNQRHCVGIGGDSGDFCGGVLVVASD